MSMPSAPVYEWPVWGWASPKMSGRRRFSLTPVRWLAFALISGAAALIAVGLIVLGNFTWWQTLLYVWLPFNVFILLLLALGARPYRISQVIAAIIFNGYFLIFFQNRELVYKGFLKYIPQPVLNCYFGPLSVFACPIGSFQQLLGLHLVPWLIIAFFSLVGVLIGRMPCGWLCTFGLWQDLLQKIPVGPRTGTRRWIAFGITSAIALAIALGLIIGVQLPWWPVLFFGWLPFEALLLFVVLNGKTDIPPRLWLGGFTASLLLAAFAWFKFEPALGIVVGAVGMALLGLTGRSFASGVAALTGALLALIGPGFRFGPLSGILLAITFALTLAVIVLLLDNWAKLHLPSTWLKFGYLITLAGIISYYTRAPWFCKLCPQGTLEAGIPQVLWNVRPDIALRSQVFWLYWVKIAILLLVIATAIMVRRPFCRLICPIGAIYSVFNKFSLLHLKVDHRCTTCRLCARVCPMDIEVHQSPNQLECIRCLECRSRCQPQSVQVKW